MKELEILISVIVAFVLGYIWYGHLFKTHWSKFAEQKQSKASKAKDYILIFLSMCAISYFMNNGCLETHINGGSFKHGIFHGGLYGLSYAVPIIAIHHVYQKKSLLDFFVDITYALLCFATIGGMLAILTLMVY